MTDTTTGDQFPPRILALLQEAACRELEAWGGAWQDENGEPLQDDADVALAWIAARAKDAEDAARYRHIRARNGGAVCVIKFTGVHDEDYCIVTEADSDREVDSERAAMLTARAKEGKI